MIERRTAMDIADTTRPAVTPRRRAVVADDDAELRRMVAHGLGRDGFEVEEVGDGSALLALVERAARGEGATPDVIVADVQMPGCTGLRVLASVRRLGLAVPMVLITAFGDDASHSLARKLGAAAMFDKPFDLAEVRRFVAHLVGA